MVEVDSCPPPGFGRADWTTEYTEITEGLALVPGKISVSSVPSVVSFVEGDPTGFGVRPDRVAPFFFVAGQG